MESILTSIKKLLGIEKEYEHFDSELIVFINGALMNANQLGIGPKEGFFITGDSETWEDFVGNRIAELEAIQTYVFQKVKLAFDPPQIGFLVDALQKQILELEWRLNVQIETPKEKEEEK